VIICGWKKPDRRITKMKKDEYNVKQLANQDGPAVADSIGCSGMRG
jgi:hypothetical protein